MFNPDRQTDRKINCQIYKVLAKVEGGAPPPLCRIYFCFCWLKKLCYTANVPIIMPKHSEFSDQPSSVSSEVSIKFIIMDYRTLFKKVLERLCLIPSDRQTNKLSNVYNI